jgi:ATP-dependent 26S proteasome regulatory subunit
MKKSTGIKLCPAQQRVFDHLSAGVQIGSVLRLWGGVGRGKTTILREFHKRHEGAFLTMKDFVRASAGNHPLALEETLYQLLFDALKSHPLVIMDDVHLLDLYSAGCHFYPRSGYFNSIMMGLCTYASEAGKKLIFSTKDHLAEAAEQRSYSFGIERFKAEDYAALITTFRGAPPKHLDFEKIFRFAPKLNAHQLKAACHWLVSHKHLTTDLFIEYLRSQRLASNVDLGEVQDVGLKDLKGVDDVLRSLEINIVLPLQNDELANRFRLRSKRGVLLYGPPGTGKTTVGRALAHRLKGKFFLIDGTFIAGTNEFYTRISHVFEAAKENAPSVIFIDDADAIFEDGEERGLYRYLLTMIDGLESESAGRVCVMMTAMDVAHLPPALVRSGRVELWLEMKLPNAQARNEIISELLKNVPEEVRHVDVPTLVTAAEGFTGADLKAMIEDGKAIYAYDTAQNAKLQPTTEYFMRAIEAVKQNKQHYAAAQNQALLQPKSPMAGFVRSFVTSQAFKPGEEDE